eukprot:462586-Rhodomonas_salina.1
MPDASRTREQAWERASASVKAFMVAKFPGLAGVEIEHEWQGVIAETPDDLPLVGAAAARQGVWLCGGFHGHGLPGQTPMQ